MRRRLLLVLCCLGGIATFAPSNAAAFRGELDFEDGVIGTLANGDDAFSVAFSETRYTGDVAHAGAQSAVSMIEAGSTGGGTWGGVWRFPENLGEGDEVWFRVWVYYPEGFDFDCGGCSEGIKFLRIWTAPGDVPSNSEGSWDYYLQSRGAVIATGVTRTFYDNHSFEEIRGIGEPIATGEWHAYELYVRLSSVPGEGIIRAWQDANLIFEDTVTATLRTRTSVATRVSIWTYWNNGAPRTQSAYVDDVVVTNEPPGDSDEYGNPRIGLGAMIVPSDAGVTDAGTPDAAFSDAGVTDAGVTDAGSHDAASPDAGADAGVATPDVSADGGTEYPSDAGAEAPTAGGGCSSTPGSEQSPFLVLLVGLLLLRTPRRS